MKILVTGGNGFIGSRVVQLLYDQGHALRLVLRQGSNRSPLEGVEFEEYVGDIRTIQWQEALQGCDAVIHAASLSSWDKLDSPELKEVIVGATQRLADTVAEKKLRMVYVSSAATFGASKRPDDKRDEASPFNLNPKRYRYAALKNEAEQHCLKTVQEKGANIVMVNPGETYGPEDHNLVTAGSIIDFCKGPMCLVCNGGITIAHVDDVANGIVSALENGKTGKRYHLAGEMLSLKQLAHLSLTIHGKKKPIITIPHFILHLYNAVFSVVRISGLSQSVTKYRYAMHYWYAGNENATNDLGTSFRNARETLEPTIQWLKEIGKVDA